MEKVSGKYPESCPESLPIWVNKPSISLNISISISTFSTFLFEDCDVSSLEPCESINTDCPEEERKYRGTENKTVRGHACKCWNDVTLSNRPSDDDPTEQDNHNFCRYVIDYESSIMTHPG